ncbi:glycosyltransferase [Sphaerotilus mobilis]|nr:glycosyltransferase [Sphaerotilus mobilis]
MLGSIAHGDWPIKEVILTIAPEAGSHLLDNRISCVDFLTPEKMLGQYEKADALVFLSLTESFGFPLIEAMWIGLPIVCPDLPYARALCNDQAVYFDPYDPESLREALWKLKQQLDGGWWPNYSVQTSKLPTNWDQVADVFVNAAIN